MRWVFILLVLIILMTGCQSVQITMYLDGNATSVVSKTLRSDSSCNATISHNATQPFIFIKINQDRSASGSASIPASLF